jgi:hypothetical protein
MPRKLLIGLILSISFVSLAQASNWLEMGTSRGVDGKKIYMDLNSIHFHSFPKDYVSVWLKFAKPDGSYTLDRFEFNRTERYRILAQDSYSATSKVLDSVDVPSPWLETPPDSIVEWLASYLFPPAKP